MKPFPHPKYSQAELASLIGKAFAKVRNDHENGNKFNREIANPIAITETGDYLNATHVASMTNSDRKLHDFRCPNKSCPGSKDGEYTRFSYRRSGKVTPHFAHLSANGETYRCGETMVHAWASEIAGQATSLSVPISDLVTKSMATDSSSKKVIDCEPVGSSRTFTAFGEAYASDAVIGHDGHLVYIEITYTHNTDERKIAYCIQNHMMVLEIDIRDCRGFSEKDFTNFVLHKAPRRWLSHPAQTIEEQRIAEEEAEAERDYKRRYAAASSSRPVRMQRTKTNYRHHAASLSKVHSLAALTSDPPASDWFLKDPEQDSNWVLDLIELAFLEPLRINHEQNRTKIRFCTPVFYDVLKTIITPDLVQFAKHKANLPHHERSLDQEVIEAFETVFADIEGVDLSPRSRDVRFGEYTEYSFGLAGKVLQRARQISESYGDAGPRVLEQWIDREDTIPARNPKKSNGGSSYIRKLRDLDSRLLYLQRRIQNPTGDPDDLVGFDNLPSLVDFSPLTNPEDGIIRCPSLPGRNPYSPPAPESSGAASPSLRYAPSETPIRIVSETPTTPTPSRARALAQKRFDEIHGPIPEDVIARFDDAARDRGSPPSSGAREYLRSIKPRIIHAEYEYRWQDSPQTALDKMSRAQFVGQATTAAEAWKRVTIAIGINLKGLKS